VLKVVVHIYEKMPTKKEWMVAVAVRIIGCALPGAVALPAGTKAYAQSSSLSPSRMVDDANHESGLDSEGEAARGRAVALNPSTGNCVTCHELPLQADFRETLGPPPAGVGERHHLGGLPLRILDGERINPDSHMASDYRISNLIAVHAD